MRMFNVTVGTKAREGDNTVLYVDDENKLYVFDKHYDSDGETKTYTIILKQGEIKWDRKSDPKHILGRYLTFTENEEGKLRAFKNIITVLSEIELDDTL